MHFLNLGVKGLIDHPISISLIALPLTKHLALILSIKFKTLVVACGSSASARSTSFSCSLTCERPYYFSAPQEVRAPNKPKPAPTPALMGIDAPPVKKAATPLPMENKSPDTEAKLPRRFRVWTYLKSSSIVVAKAVRSLIVFWRLTLHSANAMDSSWAWASAVGYCSDIFDFVVVCWSKRPIQ